MAISYNNKSTGLEGIALRKHLQFFFEEDDLARNFHYTHSLPLDLVDANIKFKSDMCVAGLPIFVEVFRYLGAEFDQVVLEDLYLLEGKEVKAQTVSGTFQLPFAIALMGERIALNLLQKSSSIATATKAMAKKVQESGKNIAILDTRKTTPGLRFLEKYAVRVGGGQNHRFGQSDLWMVKDNHKNFFRGIGSAIDFFKSQGSFYNGIEVEIHSLHEMREALDLGVKHIMLDNFSPDDIRMAIKEKRPGVTIEISGGVNHSNISNYLIEGVDAISIGSITYGAAPVDISFKFHKSNKGKK